LINCGISVAEPFAEGDSYWGTPPGSLPIHVASWRLQPKVVEILISNGSPVDIADPNGLAPLQLFVKASTGSYWSERRTTEIAKLLLDAGADPSQIKSPTGYEELDAMLSSHNR
jgi:ankyrin repeat protein